MATQIVNISNKEAISETAIMCGDKFFKDFEKPIYSQAVYRAERSIARDYKVLERKWEHTVTEEEAEADYEIEIPFLNFKAENAVIVNDSIYTKVNGELSTEDGTTEYYIRYTANQRVFNYSNKEEDDEIVIFYTSLIAGEEDYENEDAEGNANIIPVLPNVFYEEVLRRAVLWIAKLGIAQFSGEKKQKYMDLYKLYTSEDKGKDMELVRNDAWVQIKPFQYP